MQVERNDVPLENWAKFRQIFLHVLRRIGDRPGFDLGAVLTLLYFMDFDHYELHEE
jgi:hypothetical protein